MANKVYETYDLELQNGKELNLKPLNLTTLRKFMDVVDQLEPKEGEEELSEREGLEVMIQACRIAVSQFDKEFSESDEFEDAMDLPSLMKIMEVCGGMNMGGSPNLPTAKA